MLHALLVAEQHIDQHFFTSNASTWAELDEPLPSYSFVPAPSESEHHRNDFPTVCISLQLNPARRSPVRRQPEDARRALEQISALHRTRQIERQAHEEAAWLAANRVRYAGRWVALVGGNLLAVGDSARDVFQATRQTTTTPLIIRVDEEALPFAGW
jgi:hypothetical protein